MANKQLTLGSCFDGIGGWILAAQHAGIEPIWSSEIDRFPSAVTAKHFPNVKQLGDIKKLNGAKIDILPTPLKQGVFLATFYKF